MDAVSIARAARLLADARRACRPSADLPAGLRPADEAEAYDVQDALRDLLAGEGFGAPAGFKIGCTTPVMQAYLGVDHPCAGYLHARRLHEGDRDFAAGDFVRPGIECEIAVELAASLDPADAPFDRGGVARAVACLRPAIEIVDDRYEDWRTFAVPTLVADDFFQSAGLLGPRLSDWRGLDLVALTGRTRINGRPVSEGVGADVLGHPLEALAWLANHRARRGQGLAAGAVVLLGSLTQTYWMEPGDIAEIAIDGLGKLAMRYGR